MDSGIHRGKVGMLAVLAAALLPGFASANSIIGELDWDTRVPTPWLADTSDGTAADVSVENAPGNHWLQISFPSTVTSDGDPAWYELVSGSAAELFAGTWDTASWIEFNFWASNSTPEVVAVEWGNLASTNVWRNDVTAGVGAPGSWHALRSDTFATWGNWSINGAGSENEFLADLSSIDWIGVWIYRDGTSPEIYGVDDYKLMVPEPAEWLLLATALGIAFVSLRRRQLLPSACGS